MPRSYEPVKYPFPLYIIKNFCTHIANYPQDILKNKCSVCDLKIESNKHYLITGTVIKGRI